MSLDFKHLLNALLQELSQSMSEFGFKLKKKERKFEAKTPFGMTRLFLGIITHPGIDFDVTAGVGIRFDAVEDFVNEFNPVSPETGRLTSTMGGEFGNMSGVGQKRWKIISEKDIRPAVLGIIRDFKTIGLPYFERFSDFGNALQVLAGDEKENWSHSALHAKRWMSALVLAHLLKDCHRFRSIVAAGRRSLEKRADRGLKDFNFLAAKLSGEE